MRYDNETKGYADNWKFPNPPTRERNERECKILSRILIASLVVVLAAIIITELSIL